MDVDDNDEHETSHTAKRKSDSIDMYAQKQKAAKRSLAMPPLSPGEAVWAKIGTWMWWPSVIQEDPLHAGKLLVRYFGTGERYVNVLSCC